MTRSMFFRSLVRCYLGTRLLGACLFGLIGCDRVETSTTTFNLSPDAGSNGGIGSNDDGPDDEPDPTPTPTPTQPDMTAPCIETDSAEPLPARSAVTSTEIMSDRRAIFVRDLFGLFNSHCGGCHVEPASQGGFQVTQETFSSDVNSLAVDRMLSNELAMVMPPVSQGGKPASERVPGDPVLELAALLNAWIETDRPSDVFYLDTEENSDPGMQYLLSESVAETLTNIGNCVPAAALVATDETEMDELDAFFASATELPKRLDETDLVTFDSAELAQRGVVSFAPGYPLFSDAASKMRIVRVPRGESIAFNSATQEFDIPPNTRFYKTFLRKVIDSDGNESFRKVETRLIVARPDLQKEDGSFEPTALFGSYLWNESETEAVLIEDPLRNGEPFRDHLLTVVLDELEAKEITESNPPDLVKAFEEAKITRTYAIPGSERCIQCHMGSRSRSFVLGFTPLQLARRPNGEGGVIDATGPDELNQLNRLIEYGIITGMESQDDVIPLEESQGERTPRNEYELIAQGYLFGNCANCHNPRGFPSVQNPVLSDVLDFFPRPEAGVFQFPLDRTSPRIFRGFRLDIPMPYITPSLYDWPGAAGQTEDSFGIDFRAKYYGPPTQEERDAVSDEIIEIFGAPVKLVEAPWRSLIYRNVETPFTYSDHYAVFPHMPLNVAGYDCRAKRIVGDWMVSIPSQVLPLPTGQYDQSNRLPQPYVEVRPGEEAYDAALDLAAARLELFHTSERYTDCPDDSDIVDPRVGTKDEFGETVIVPPTVADPVTRWQDGIPDRAHWVVTDTTEPVADWAPRRPDWESSIVDKLLEEVAPDEQLVISLLDDLALTDELRDLALTAVPFGLWLEKPECNFAGVPRAASFTGATKPRWLSHADVVTSLRPDGSNPLYMQSPGAAVFELICSNCHGPQADGRSILANTILQLTGGATRVADLRGGLFGPIDAPATNRTRIFGSVVDETGISVDDWAGRYTVWMGLGGTQRQIPRTALVTVGNRPVLGTAREFQATLPEGSANMLTIVQLFCQATLPGFGNLDASYSLSHGALLHEPENPALRGTGLLGRNGDGELWESLCALNNPPPVRVIRASTSSTTGAIVYGPNPLLRSRDLFWPVDPATGAVVYPATAPVGDHRGRIAMGVAPDNRFPWCLQEPTDPVRAAEAEAYAQANAIGGVPLPFCPPALLTTFGSREVVDPVTGMPSGQTEPNEIFRVTEADIQRWSLRGAMNAGLAVFAYLDSVARGATPQVPYDRCERLNVP